MSNTLVIGAGHGSLTVAGVLARTGYPPPATVKGVQVGGTSRTEAYGGYRFDIGGHPFFTKAGEVEALWHEVLGDDGQPHEFRGGSVEHSYREGFVVDEADGYDGASVPVTADGRAAALTVRHRAEEA